MKWKRLEWVLACVMLLTVVSCRGGAPVYQVKDAPIQTASGKEIGIEQVRKEIIAAGATLGWEMADSKPGEIIGTLNIRSHQAVVSIPYTAKSYSILYKDSTNLKYDAEAHTIHKNYTGWVQRLDSAIRSRLMAAGM